MSTAHSSLGWLITLDARNQALAACARRLASDGWGPSGSQARDSVIATLRALERGLAATEDTLLDLDSVRDLAVPTLRRTVACLLPHLRAAATALAHTIAPWSGLHVRPRAKACLMFLESQSAFTGALASGRAAGRVAARNLSDLDLLLLNIATAVLAAARIVLTAATALQGGDSLLNRGILTSTARSLHTTATVLFDAWLSIGNPATRPCATR